MRVKTGMGLGIILYFQVSGPGIELGILHMSGQYSITRPLRASMDLTRLFKNIYFLFPLRMDEPCIFGNIRNILECL